MGSWPSTQVSIGTELEKKVYWDLRAQEESQGQAVYWNSWSWNTMSRQHRNTKPQRPGQHGDNTCSIHSSALLSSGVCCSGLQEGRYLLRWSTGGLGAKEGCQTWWCPVLCSELLWGHWDHSPSLFPHASHSHQLKRKWEEFTVSVRSGYVFCLVCFFYLLPLYLLYSHYLQISVSDSTLRQRQHSGAEVQEAMFPLVSESKMTLCMMAHKILWRPRKDCLSN